MALKRSRVQISYAPPSKPMDEVEEIIAKEQDRQTDGLELIPSENYASKAVLNAMGSVLTNKYSEGYPGHRYYGGQENIDAIEEIAIARAESLFHADHANVQPHSGSNANEATYFAWAEPGDTIISMSLPAGGHLTHGALVTRAARTYHFVHYGVTDDGDINYGELEKLIKTENPKIVLVGYSAFMKIPDFQRIVDMVKSVDPERKNIMLMADMAHVAGLIVASEHPNPLDFGFNVLTTTTHKTLRGPRGGLILSMGNVGNPLKKPEKTLENLPILIDRAVFPGTQGGPLENIIAAKAVAFGEAMRPEFKTYAKQIKKNASALAEKLSYFGFKLQGGGTENHLILIDLSDTNIDGKSLERALDLIGITANANTLPSDKAGSFRPGGLRLGTPAITTRGMKEPEMEQIASWIHRVYEICLQAGSEEELNNFTEELETLREEVRNLARLFPLPF